METTQNKQTATEDKKPTFSLNYVRRMTDNYNLSLEEAQKMLTNYIIVE